MGIVKRLNQDLAVKICKNFLNLNTSLKYFIYLGKQYGTASIIV